MEYRRMGNTGLELSSVGLGSWITFKGQIDDDKAMELMVYAYDNGVNFFDNAEVYAFGESEKMMGRILKKTGWDRSSFVLSSKAFFGKKKNPKPNQKGLSRKHLYEACNEALQRMQVDYLDLFYCHRPDENTPMEETVYAMNELIQRGKILYWGTSEWEAKHLESAFSVAEKYGLQKPVVEQPEYNLLKRDKVEQEFATFYNKPGLGLTIWSPLASGMLTGKYNKGIPEGSRLSMKENEWLKNKLLNDHTLETVKQLGEVADDAGMSLADLSIAFCVRNPTVTCTILGASSLDQLKQNINAADMASQLDDEIIARLDAITAPKPH